MNNAEKKCRRIKSGRRIPFSPEAAALWIFAVLRYIILFFISVEDSLEIEAT